MTKTHTFRYQPKGDEDTCKTTFDFELTKEGNEIFISNLTVEGEKGCIGQNKILPVLIKNRKIQEISINDLKEAGCKRASSCGQQLAIALQQIVDKEFTD
ncbi:MAG: TSCPD domain-containing protein [Candidatus Heimdallarchaeota archaeon]